MQKIRNTEAFLKLLMTFDIYCVNNKLIYVCITIRNDGKNVIIQYTYILITHIKYIICIQAVFMLIVVNIFDGRYMERSKLKSSFGSISCQHFLSRYSLRCHLKFIFIIIDERISSCLRQIEIP